MKKRVRVVINIERRFIEDTPFLIFLPRPYPCGTPVDFHTGGAETVIVNDNELIAKVKHRELKKYIQK
jgi:hypothetical protein